MTHTNPSHRRLDSGRQYYGSKTRNDVTSPLRIVNTAGRRRHTAIRSVGMSHQKSDDFCYGWDPGRTFGVDSGRERGAVLDLLGLSPPGRTLGTAPGNSDEGCGGTGSGTGAPGSEFGLWGGVASPGAGAGPDPSGVTSGLPGGAIGGTGAGGVKDGTSVADSEGLS